ncbi:MAG: chromate reductase [Planctomycetota bacterium]|jgi:chromate reductase
MNTKIVGIVGSLREKSYNQGLMEAFKDALPEGVEMEIVTIGTLPLFNEDLESEFPLVAQNLKDVVEGADALIIATPEYNRSFPGVLKNAIDWLSRPYGKNSFAGKPTLVVGVSVGANGTAMAQYHLKQLLLYLSAHVLGQPEFFVGNAGSKFDESGKLTDEKTKAYITPALEKLMSVIGN